MLLWLKKGNYIVHESCDDFSEAAASLQITDKFPVFSQNAELQLELRLKCSFWMAAGYTEDFIED